MGDGFYTSKDPTNSIISVLKEKATKENSENAENKNTKYTYKYSTR